MNLCFVNQCFSNSPLLDKTNGASRIQRASLLAFC